ncbi:hypothetical protein FGL74_00080 [Leuconostoc koreense]|nr:hypothetical protein FGL74_00080 [Leuconostoc mesenteroides]QGM25722.1 hypothetical protein GJV51_06930 [Leuconostoc mesenteroides subsp. mesenteroides]
MAKKVWIGITILILATSTMFLIQNHKEKERIQLKQKSKKINQQEWSKADYEDLLTGENLSADKPYTSNQVSMYLKIIHDHGKPISRKTVKKDDVIETTAKWRNIKNQPKETVTLVFQGTGDESLILMHKESTVWAN